jgi:hypothetical protein
MPDRPNGSDQAYRERLGAFINIPANVVSSINDDQLSSWASTSSMLIINLTVGIGLR